MHIKIEKMHEWWITSQLLITKLFHHSTGNKVDLKELLKSALLTGFRNWDRGEQSFIMTHNETNGQFFTGGYVYGCFKEKTVKSFGRNY